MDYQQMKLKCKLKLFLLQAVCCAFCAGNDEEKVKKTAMKQNNYSIYNVKQDPHTEVEWSVTVL
jgi:hypothetical protein